MMNRNEIRMCDKDYKAVMNSKIGDTINLEHGGAIDVVAVPYDTRCSRCFNSGKAPIDGNLCYACVFATNNAVATVGEYLAFVEHVDAAAAEPVVDFRAECREAGRLFWERIRDNGASEGVYRDAVEALKSANAEYCHADYDDDQAYVDMIRADARVGLIRVVRGLDGTREIRAQEVKFASMVRDDGTARDKAVDTARWAFNFAWRDTVAAKVARV